MMMRRPAAAGGAGATPLPNAVARVAAGSDSSPAVVVKAAADATPQTQSGGSMSGMGTWPVRFQKSECEPRRARTLTV